MDGANYDVSKYGRGPIDLEKRRSLTEDDFLGDRVPERLGQGPVEVRRVTDILCLVACMIFFLFFIVMTFVYSFINNYQLMLKPLDSDARICGQDDPVKNHPYLYLFKFDRNYRSVCVSECPKFDYNQIKYNSNGSNTSYIQPLYFENYTTVVRNSIIYGDSDTPRTTSFDFDGNFAAGYYNKTQFDTYRQRFTLNCIPNTDVKSCTQNIPDGINYYDSRPYALNICFPLSSKIMLGMGFFGDISKGIFSDLSNAVWMIFLSFLTALIFALLILFLSSYFIQWLIWVQFGLFILVALFIGVCCWIVAFGDYSEYLRGKGWKPELVKQYAQLYNEKWQMILLGLFCFILAICIGLFFFFNIKSIKQAAVILKHGVGVVIRNFELIILCIILFVVQIVAFFTALWIAVGIYTSGQMNKDSVVGAPIADFNVGFWRWLLIILTFFAAYWILCFINNFGDFLTSATIVNYYFQRKRKLLQALTDTSIYHLGSVAIASLILLPVTLLQIMFGWLFDLLTATGLEGDPNAFQKIASKVCICIVYPYKKWILRIEEVAFAMVYLTSADYCPSSKETYYLFLAYQNKIGRLGLVSLLYKVVVALSISFFNAWMFYGIFSYFSYFIRNINNPLVPSFFIFLTSLLITLIFLNVFTTATNACVLCYLIELDIGKVPRDKELERQIAEAEGLGGGAANRYDPLK